MIVIRPFEPTDEEYARVVELWNRVWPDELKSVALARHDDASRPPERLFQRVVMVDGDEIPAVATYQESRWAHVPGKYEIYVLVHPERRREGLATYMYKYILDQLAERDPGPVKLVSNTREKQAGALAMLEKHGFKQIMRGPISTLDVAAFDPEPFEAKTRAVRDAEIEIVTLAELSERDPGWERKSYDLDWELEQDVPSPDPPVRLSFEVWREMFLDGPAFLPEGTFLALDGERWVGISTLARWGANEDTLFQGLTGVVRSHRRRGIATALKLKTIEFAREYGAEKIQTDNEENNPMYLLNLRLGFAPQPAWIEFEREWEGANDWQIEPDDEAA